MKRSRDWRFYVSRAFMECPRVPLSEKAVFIALLGKANKDGQCWPTYQQLEDELNICERTFRDHADKLETTGWIHREHWYDRRGNKRICYTIATISL